MTRGRDGVETELTCEEVLVPGLMMCLLSLLLSQVGLFLCKWSEASFLSFFLAMDPLASRRSKKQNTTETRLEGKVECDGPSTGPIRGCFALQPAWSTRGADAPDWLPADR